MKILFDNGTPNPIARFLPGHDITFARKMGWHEFSNGELIQRAEDAGFDLLLTSDKNIRYQQNLKHRKIALVVLEQNRWPAVRLQLKAIADAIDMSLPGSYTEVPIPFEP